MTDPRLRKVAGMPNASNGPLGGNAGTSSNNKLPANVPSVYAQYLNNAEGNRQSAKSSSPKMLVNVTSPSNGNDLLSSMNEAHKANSLLPVGDAANPLDFLKLSSLIPPHLLPQHPNDQQRSSSTAPEHLLPRNESESVNEIHNLLVSLGAQDPHTLQKVMAALQQQHQAPYNMDTRGNSAPPQQQQMPLPPPMIMSPRVSSATRTPNMMHFPSQQSGQPLNNYLPPNRSLHGQNVLSHNQSNHEAPSHSSYAASSSGMSSLPMQIQSGPAPSIYEPTPPNLSSGVPDAAIVGVLLKLVQSCENIEKTIMPISANLHNLSENSLTDKFSGLIQALTVVAAEANETRSRVVSMEMTLSRIEQRLERFDQIVPILMLLAQGTLSQGTLSNPTAPAPSNFDVASNSSSLKRPVEQAPSNNGFEGTEHSLRQTKRRRDQPDHTDNAPRTILCINCGSFEHSGRHCPLERRICHRCRKPGHIAQFCLHKEGKSVTKAEIARQAAEVVLSTPNSTSTPSHGLKFGGRNARRQRDAISSETTPSNTNSAKPSPASTSSTIPISSIARTPLEHALKPPHASSTAMQAIASGPTSASTLTSPGANDDDDEEGEIVPGDDGDDEEGQNTPNEEAMEQATDIDDVESSDKQYQEVDTVRMDENEEEEKAEDVDMQDLSSDQSPATDLYQVDCRQQKDTVYEDDTSTDAAASLQKESDVTPVSGASIFEGLGFINSAPEDTGLFASLMSSLPALAAGSSLPFRRASSRTKSSRQS